MKKQNKSIILRINETLKDEFNKKAEINNMTLSARIKYLMQKDIEDKILIKNGKI